MPLFIWIGIAVFCLVTFGAALGLYLWSREAFGSNDLKKATSVTITYALKGNSTKSVVVSDPAELQDLLDALDDHRHPARDARYVLSRAGMGRVHAARRDRWRTVFVDPDAAGPGELGRGLRRRRRSTAR